MKRGILTTNKSETFSLLVSVDELLTLLRAAGYTQLPKTQDAPSGKPLEVHAALHAVHFDWTEESSNKQHGKADEDGGAQITYSLPNRS